jgi:hypothetical protein
VDDSLQIDLLLTRLQSQRLAEALPDCEERNELRNTMLACDLMLKNLKSGSVTQERVIEIRQSYESWKQSKD